MACGLCHHCMGALAPNDSIRVQNYSYHKSCKKCYVCSETDLQEAEIFKGVIFCEGCSKRIFQGCTTARRSRNSRDSTSRACSRTSSRRRHNRCSNKLASSSIMGQHRIIEMVHQMAARRSQTSNISSNTQYKSNIVVTSTALSLGLRDGILQKNLKESDKNITEVGIATEVTQELLRQMNYPVEYIPQNPQRPLSKAKKYKLDEGYDFKSITSDPRILELGASTEIATMPLRNKSEIPVQTQSDPIVASEKKSASTNPLTDSYETHSDDYQGSILAEERFKRRQEHNTSLLNILKTPLRKFKEKIINRRSLVAVDREIGDVVPFLKKTKKWLLEDETINHQKRGLENLYSTIIRKQKRPYKMGWLPLMTKSQHSWRSNPDVPRCKHYRNSHSYRCMRALVMSRAGPTKTELKEIRNRIWDFILPKWVRNISLSDELTIESYTRSIRTHTHTQSTRTYTQSTVTRDQSLRTESRSKDQSVSIRLISST